MKYHQIVFDIDGTLIDTEYSPYEMECAAKADVDFALASWGAKTKLHTAISFNTVLDAIQFFNK